MDPSPGRGLGDVEAWQAHRARALRIRGRRPLARPSRVSIGPRARRRRGRPRRRSRAGPTSTRVPPGAQERRASSSAAIEERAAVMLASDEVEGAGEQGRRAVAADEIEVDVVQARVERGGVEGLGVDVHADDVAASREAPPPRPRMPVPRAHVEDAAPGSRRRRLVLEGTQAEARGLVGAGAEGASRVHDQRSGRSSGARRLPGGRDPEPPTAKARKPSRNRATQSTSGTAMASMRRPGRPARRVPQRVQGLGPAGK